jgi:hypothetical protein
MDCKCKFFIEKGILHQPEVFSGLKNTGALQGSIANFQLKQQGRPMYLSDTKKRREQLAPVKKINENKNTNYF